MKKSVLNSSDILGALETGRIKRYSSGIYYAPKRGKLGESVLEPTKILSAKYMQDREGEQIGYWSGATLDNMIGLSTQVPNVLEIVSNNTSIPQRSIDINGKQKCILRQARVPVKNENVEVLQFLDVLTRWKPSAFSAGQIQKLGAFAKGISRDELMRNSLAFPQKTTRRLVESEVLGVFA